MGRFKVFYGWENDIPEWVGKFAEEYEVLVDMHSKKVICMITEPEDRSFTRDLSAITEYLNDNLQV